MQRGNNLAHLILAGVIALVLAQLMVYVDAQAQIAFTSRRDGNSEIYVMEADGGNQQRLTENRSNDWFPSWSPNGKRIVFSSDRDRPSGFDIYVMDADGGNPQRLTNNPRTDAHSAWFGSAFAVTPVGKILTMWGWIKQANRQLPLLREQH